MALLFIKLGVSRRKHLGKRPPSRQVTIFWRSREFLLHASLRGGMRLICRAPADRGSSACGTAPKANRNLPEIRGQLRKIGCRGATANCWISRQRRHAVVRVTGFNRGVGASAGKYPGRQAILSLCSQPRTSSFEAPDISGRQPCAGLSSISGPGWCGLQHRRTARSM